MDYLDQADVAMPESLIQEKAKECFTYSIMVSLSDMQDRHLLMSGLQEILAKEEGAASPD